MTSGKFLPLLVLGGSLLVQGHKSRPPPPPPSPNTTSEQRSEGEEERATRLLGGWLFQAEGTRECLADIEELA